MGLKKCSISTTFLKKAYLVIIQGQNLRPILDLAFLHLFQAWQSGEHKVGENLTIGLPLKHQMSPEKNTQIHFDTSDVTRKPHRDIFPTSNVTRKRCLIIAMPVDLVEGWQFHLRLQNGSFIEFTHLLKDYTGNGLNLEKPLEQSSWR